MRSSWRQPYKDEYLESAAILMGDFSEMRQSFYGDEAEEQKMIWLERGKGAVKRR